METSLRRESAPDVVRLRALIDMLVEELRKQGGDAKAQDVKIATARRAGISISELNYVVINAVADGRIGHSLRSNRLTLLDG